MNDRDVDTMEWDPRLDQVYNPQGKCSNHGAVGCERSFIPVVRILQETAPSPSEVSQDRVFHHKPTPVYVKTAIKTDPIEKNPPQDGRENWSHMIDSLIVQARAEKTAHLKNQLKRIFNDALTQAQSVDDLDSARRILDLTHKMIQADQLVATTKPQKEHLIEKCVRLIDNSALNSDWVLAKVILEAAVRNKWQPPGETLSEYLLLVHRKLHQDLSPHLHPHFNTPAKNRCLINHHILLAEEDEREIVSCLTAIRRVGVDQLTQNDALRITTIWSRCHSKSIKKDGELRQFVLSLFRRLPCDTWSLWAARWTLLAKSQQASAIVDAWKEMLTTASKNSPKGSAEEKLDCFQKALQTLSSLPSLELVPLVTNKIVQNSYQAIAPENLCKDYAELLINSGMNFYKEKRDLLSPLLDLAQSVSLKPAQLMDLCLTAVSDPSISPNDLTIQMFSKLIDNSQNPVQVEGVIKKLFQKIKKETNSLKELIDKMGNSSFSRACKLELVSCLIGQGINPRFFTPLLSATPKEIQENAAQSDVMNTILTQMGSQAWRHPEESAQFFRIMLHTVQPPTTSLQESYMNALLQKACSSNPLADRKASFHAFIKTLDMFAPQDLLYLQLKPSIADTLLSLSGEESELESFYFELMDPLMNFFIKKPARAVAVCWSSPIISKFLDYAEESGKVDYFSIAQNILAILNLHDLTDEDLVTLRPFAHACLNDHLDNCHQMNVTKGQLASLQRLLSECSKILDPNAIELVNAIWSQGAIPDGLEAKLEEYLSSVLKMGKPAEAFNFFSAMLPRLFYLQKWDLIKCGLQNCLTSIIINSDFNEFYMLVDLVVQINKNSKQKHTEMTEMNSLLLQGLVEGLSQQQALGGISYESYSNASSILCKIRKSGSVNDDIWLEAADALLSHTPSVCQLSAALHPMAKLMAAFNTVILTTNKIPQGRGRPRVIQEMKQIPGVNSKLAIAVLHSYLNQVANLVGMTFQVSCEDLWSSFLSSMKQSNAFNFKAMLGNACWMTDAILFDLLPKASLVEESVRLWMSQASEASLDNVNEAIYLNEALEDILKQLSSQMDCVPLACEWTRRLRHLKTEIIADWNTRLKYNKWTLPKRSRKR